MVAARPGRRRSRPARVRVASAEMCAGPSAPGRFLQRLSFAVGSCSTGDDGPSCPPQRDGGGFLCASPSSSAGVNTATPLAVARGRADADRCGRGATAGRHRGGEKLYQPALTGACRGAFRGPQRGELNIPSARIRSCWSGSAAMSTTSRPRGGRGLVAGPRCGLRRRRLRGATTASRRPADTYRARGASARGPEPDRLPRGKTIYRWQNTPSPGPREQRAGEGGFRLVVRSGR